MCVAFTAYLHLYSTHEVKDALIHARFQCHLALRCASKVQPKAFDTLRRSSTWNNSFQSFQVHKIQRFLIDKLSPMGIGRKTFLKAKLKRCSKGSFYSQLFSLRAIRFAIDDFQKKNLLGKKSREIIYISSWVRKFSCEKLTATEWLKFLRQGIGRGNFFFFACRGALLALRWRLSFGSVH